MDEIFVPNIEFVYLITGYNSLALHFSIKWLKNTADKK